LEAAFCNAGCAVCIIRGLFVRAIQKRRRGTVDVAPVEFAVELAVVDRLALFERANRVSYGEAMITIVTYDTNLQIEIYNEQ